MKKLNRSLGSILQANGAPLCSVRFSRVSGFTLIELMVAVAIIALLTSLALPAYTSHVARAKRADAKAQLVQAAQFMQRFYAANDSFAKDRANNDVLSQIPAALTQSPADSAKIYDLAIPAESLSATGFELRMVPGVGSSMENDPCGSFTLTSAGLRGVLVGNLIGDANLRDSCWR